MAKPPRHEEPAEIIAFFRRHGGWITAEPVGGIYQVRVHWRPELSDLSQDFEDGGAALRFTLLAAQEHGLVAALAFRPGEIPHERG